MITLADTQPLSLFLGILVTLLAMGALGIIALFWAMDRIAENEFEEQERKLKATKKR